MAALNKRTVKKLYKDYIFGKKVDGIDWEKYFPVFNRTLTEIDVEDIHKQYLRAKA
jgi:hypothetical protein